MKTTVAGRLPDAGGGPDLIHDLAGCEVAAEAQLTGRAEEAPDRASDLRTDADGVARARP